MFAKNKKHKAMASILEKHHNDLKNHLNKHLEKHPNLTIKVNPLTEREKTLAIKVINDNILDYDEVHIGNDNDYSKDDLKRVIKKIKLGYDKFTPKEANALNSSSYMALMSINDNDEYYNDNDNNDNDDLINSNTDNNYDHNYNDNDNNETNVHNNDNDNIYYIVVQ